MPGPRAALSAPDGRVASRRRRPAAVASVVMTELQIPALAGSPDTSELVLGRPMVRELGAGWLLGYSSPHTRRAYGADLARWVAWCEQLHVDPREAGRVHVDAWARYLDEGLGLAPASTARRLAVISSFYRWCVQQEHLASNPAVHVRRPEVDPDESATIGLSAADARALLAAAGAHSRRLHALVALLLVDGLRISEALGLDVHQVLDVDRGHRVAQLRRKGGKGGRAALPPLVADAVDRYLDERAELAGVPVEQLAGPLFVTASGARWRPGNAARALSAVARRAELAGWRKITPHALRHSAITLALAAGVPLHEVQDFAGHRDPRSTRRYDRARGRLDRHASYTLAAELA